MLCNYLYYFYIVHSMHYDIFKLWYHQQMHNSTINISFLLFSFYMFWHCHSQGALTPRFHYNIQQYIIYNKHTYTLLSVVQLG